MTMSLIMNGINIAGNAVMLYGLGCGVEGAAIPTAASRVFAGIWMLIRICDSRKIIYVRTLLGLRIKWKIMKKILHLGIPCCLENSMFQLGKILVLSLVSTFGTYAIAANAVSNAIALFQILPGMAMGLAITTVISRCVGAGDYEQVRYYTRKLLLITYAGLTIMSLFIYAILPFVLKVYNLSEAATEAATKIITFHTLGTILIWALSFSLPSVFRAAGDAKACMIISIISMWVFRIGFSYILGKYMEMGVFGIWVAMVIDWVFRTICFVIRYFRGTWKKMAIV